MIKKLLIAVVGILAIFIITNPSLSDFNEFAPSQFDGVINDNKIHTSRVKNYFVYSIFKVQAIEDLKHKFFYQKEYRFYGVFGNFYYIDYKVKTQHY